MKKIILGLFIIVVVIIGVYYFIYRSGNSEGEQRAASTVFAEEGEITDEFAEEINIVEAFGNIIVKEEINVTLDFPVKIEDVMVKTGDKVAFGDQLITLDISDTELRYKKLNRQLQIAENELENIERSNDIVMGQIEHNLKTDMSLYQEENRDLQDKKDDLHNESSPDFIKLLNELKIARRKLEGKREELTDQKILLEAGALTQYSFDEFIKTVIDQEDAVKMIELTLNELRYNKREEIRLLGKSLSERLSRIDGYKLQLEEQRANVQQRVYAQAKEIEGIREELGQLEKSLYDYEYLDGNRIISVFDKTIVSNINCTHGDYRQEGQIIISLLNLDKIIVEADVPEEFIRDVKEGASVTISPLASPDREYHGKVIGISDMAEKRGGETVIPVEISIDNEDGFLLPNFNVDVEIVKSD